MDSRQGCTQSAKPRLFGRRNNLFCTGSVTRWYFLSKASEMPNQERNNTWLAKHGMQNYYNYWQIANISVYPEMPISFIFSFKQNTNPSVINEFLFPYPINECFDHVNILTFLESSQRCYDFSIYCNRISPLLFKCSRVSCDSTESRARLHSGPESHFGALT